MPGAFKFTKIWMYDHRYDYRTDRVPISYKDISTCQDSSQLQAMGSMRLTILNTI